MSSKGVVDLVFCIDASGSMKPCFNAVRGHLLDFIKGLETGQQRKVDCQLDFLAHCCGERGGPFHLVTLRKADMDVCEALYRGGGQGQFFTRDPAELQRALEAVEVSGDEATLVALDFVLDFPWRPRNQGHRVVVCLTDEPLESGAALEMQRAKLPELMDKIEKLGVMLFLVAPQSEGYQKLSEVNRCVYRSVGQAGDGLKTVDFATVLAHIGKSVSAASLQAAGDSGVPRALFGQDRWTASNEPILGR